MNSKITVNKSNEILEGIFAIGHSLALSTTDPNDRFTEPSVASYTRYEIKDGDFKASGSAITTANHILYGLAEESWGTIIAFGVYDEQNILIYWGLLNEEVVVPEDTVPVFKIYNETAGEGIKVTLDAVETTSASV